MARSSPDWRMRSASEDVRDNITRTERGPLGSGGDGGSVWGARSGGHYAQRTASSKDGVNVREGQGHGGIGLNPDERAEGFTPNCAVPDA